MLFIFCFAGFGGNGFGGNNGAMDNYVLNSDFATLQRQIDSGISSLERKGDTINAGLCDGFYAMNSTLLNGFSNAELTRANNTASIIAQLNNNAYQDMQNTTAIREQLANCCCENEKAIMQSNYNFATEACATRQAIADSTRTIIDAMNAKEVNALKDRINEQNTTINALNLAQSQAQQNNYLISQLRPSPIPAYTVSNPYGYYYGTTIS